MRDHSPVFYRDVNTVPPEIVRGKGVWLEDRDGRRYLDGSASAGVVGIGHGRSEIWQSLANEGDGVTFVYNATFTHPWQEQLAERILSVAPPNMAGVYFVSGGSEANESAWKLARQYHVERGRPQKYKAISRWQSYHGVTLATLSLSGRTSWREIYAPLLLDVPHIPAPYDYRGRGNQDPEEYALACADELERAILLEGPDNVAVFFAEPIVGTTVAGLTPHPSYYPRIREICDRYDVLFVADEVLCGYGRAGTPFAIQGWKTEPDIITMGKAIGSGYAPLGAMVVSKKVRDVFRVSKTPFIHGLTYSGTPSACFIGIQVHDIMLREGLFTRAATIGKYLSKRLRALADQHEIIGEVRGRGLLQGVEFVQDRASRKPFPPGSRLTQRIVGHMRANGVLVAAGIPRSNFGKDGDHIQISPPFTITEAEVDRIVEALDMALASIDLLE